MTIIKALRSKEQEIIDQLTASWVWPAEWIDSSTSNTAGRIVKFTRVFELACAPSKALLHFSADTRYKLYVNGKRIAAGPSRGSSSIWYYDSQDIGQYLHKGSNELKFIVLRYFSSSRGAIPFERTVSPGLTVLGSVEAEKGVVDLSSLHSWEAEVDESVLFPTGLIDDIFLHINERIQPRALNRPLPPRPYNLKTLNGELAPWRLHPRCIPMPEETSAIVDTIRICQSHVSIEEWSALLAGGKSIALSPKSSHTLHLQAKVHSTAFLTWKFQAARQSQIRLKITYSEGYEFPPRSYPFFRSKGDRLDAQKGLLIGPFDEVVLDLPEQQIIDYEPFWFRTFHIIALEIAVTGPGPIDFVSFEAKQVNYPLGVKASWNEPQNPYSSKIWEVSIRTLRNCMFDAYSDCPFYEQLQYSGDSRSVGLFHYLLSGDDRLMRQTITNFASSVTPEGLTQSRFPSHVPQIIAGFPLYWILQVSDHYLYFGDRSYTRSFLSRIDGILDFFDRHVDELGLVSGLPHDVWQYVDWVTTWGATEDHPDKGVIMNTSCQDFLIA